MQQKKTNVYHIHDIWSLDILGLKDYGPENNGGYRYVLVIIDNFSKFGWRIPIKNKNAQTIKDSFENILINSNRKPNLIESDRGKEFITTYFKTSYIKTISNFILEIFHMVMFLQNALIVLSKISLKRSFSNKVMEIGLIFYLK